jgi:hypothetical protein
MVIQLLVMFATVAMADFQLQQFTKDTCTILDTWDQTPHGVASVQYILNGQETTKSLTSNCETQLQSSLEDCRKPVLDGLRALSNRLFTGLRGSSLVCSQLLILISNSTSPDPVPRNAKYGKRLVSARANSDCSCEKNEPSQVGDSAATTTSRVTLLSVASTDPSETTDARGKTSSTPVNTVSTLLNDNATPTASPTSALSKDRVCIIKHADWASIPQGRCRCLDKSSIAFSSEECDIYL